MFECTYMGKSISVIKTHYFGHKMFSNMLNIPKSLKNSKCSFRNLVYLKFMGEDTRTPLPEKVIPPAILIGDNMFLAYRRFEA